MESNEYALELYYKFTTYAPLHSDNKKCALIAVDEILSFVNSFDDDSIEFLIEVKQEIEKL
tara:strand:- start:196 stop:378 length:183 start_codon:yes stop_codon:yes gene_type:complete